MSLPSLFDEVVAQSAAMSSVKLPRQASIFPIECLSVDVKISSLVSIISLTLSSCKILLFVDNLIVRQTLTQDSPKRTKTLLSEQQ